MSKTKYDFKKGTGYVPDWYAKYPSLKINKALGNGIPSGTIMQIQSDGEGTFKTTTAIQIAADAQRQGKDVAYIDVENATYWEETGDVDENGNPIKICPWFEKLGLDSRNIYYIEAGSQELIYSKIKELIINYNVKFVIIDSIPSLEPESIHEKEAGENTIGLRAKINTTELVKLLGIYRQHHAIICGINHKKEVITNQDSMGKKAVGGRGYGFYSQIIIVNKRTTSKSTLEGKDYIDLEVYIEKSKVGDSFIKGTVKVKQGEGITPDFDFLEEGLRTGIIQKKNAGWYRWKPTDEAIAQGDQQIMEWIKANRKLIQETLNEKE